MSKMTTGAPNVCGKKRPNCTDLVDFEELDEHPILATEAAPPGVQSDIITHKIPQKSHQNHHKSDQVTIQTYT